MLDSHARKYAEPFITGAARSLLKLGLSANQVTCLAMGFGILSALLLLAGMPYAALGILWLSGYLDALDGAMARLSDTSSSWGTLIDITGDRVVEAGIIIALAILSPESAFALLCLLCAILFSITVFLTTGALAAKSGIKSFYYQPGMMERTEGFIMLSLMMVFPSLLIYLSVIFALLVLYTGFQRLREAHEIFKR